jgi:cell division protein ZapA
MAGRTVHLRVGGQTYRVVTSASDEELQRLAAVVDQKLAAVCPPGRTITPQAMLLAAMALAHELEEERARSEAVKTRARGAFGRMLERVDAALGELPADGAGHDGGAAPRPPSIGPEPGRSPMMPAGPRPSLGVPSGRPANES